MTICPNCGYDLSEKKPANFTPMIQMLLSSKSESTQKMLRNILSIAREYHPIRTKDIFFFLKAIEDADDRIIRYSIDQYYTKGHYLKKGLPYLKAMIVNYNKNKDEIREIERKVYGTKPPYREVK